MNERSRAIAALPSDEQRLLLRAALLDGAPARRAWLDWQARTNLETIDLESARLLPLLYDNLRRHGVAEAPLARYASVYRRTWAKNRLLFLRGAEVITALERSGVGTLLLKGAALALRHYASPALRAMEDLDLLVPRAQLDTARAVLAARGFSSTADERPSLRHSLNLADGRGGRIDLHWYASAEARRPGDDDELWRTAVPVQIEGVRSRALDPTFQLYHVCAHAYLSEARHVRWLADAYVLSTSSAAIDWPRLIACARARRFVLPLTAALHELRHILDVSIPRSALAALTATRIALVDRLEHTHRTSARRYAAGKILLRMWCDHRRSSPVKGAACVAAFPDYLMRYYRVRTPRRLLTVAVTRTLRRIRESGFI